MKNACLIYISFWFHVIANCHANYYINFEPQIQVFLEDKAAYFKQHVDASWKIEILNNVKNPLDFILMRVGNFIVHNDRDRRDCCEFCYYLKVLNDKKIIFSEENKQKILKSIQILIYYFVRIDDYPVSSVGCAQEVFKDYDYESLFVFEDLTKPLSFQKEKSCIFL